MLATPRRYLSFRNAKYFFRDFALFMLIFFRSLNLSSRLSYPEFSLLFGLSSLVFLSLGKKIKNQSMNKTDHTIQGSKAKQPNVGKDRKIFDIFYTKIRIGCC
jgi:hypothetical protein